MPDRELQAKRIIFIATINFIDGPAANARHADSGRPVASIVG
jgi:hypothetical protein